MARLAVAAVISVVLAVVLVGCSNDSADPGATSASTSSAAPPTQSVSRGREHDVLDLVGIARRHKYRHGRVTEPHDFASLAIHAGR